MARLWKASECGASYDTVWKRVIEQSTLAHIPPLRDLSFTHLVMLCWSFMGMQMLFALAYTVPLRAVGFDGTTRDKVDYEVPASQEEAMAMCFEYRTLGDDRQNHGAALMILSEASRMMAPVFQDGVYAQKKMQLNLTRRSPGFERSFLHIGYHQMLHGVTNFLNVGVLECALQLNLQVSQLAMTRELNHAHHFHTFTKVSLSLNMFIFLVKLLSAKTTYALYRMIRKEVQGGCTTVNGILPTLETVDAATDEARKQLQEVRDLWHSVRRCYCLFMCYVILYLLLFVYAFAKFLAWGFCPSGMLNLNGCAKLQ